MSKSKIKPKEFLQDLDSILNIISKLDNIDVSKKNNISKLVKLKSYIIVLIRK